MKCISLNGRSLAAKIEKSLKYRVMTLSAEGKRRPCLAILQIGDNPASTIYTKRKIDAAKRVNFQTRYVSLPDHVLADRVIDVLHNLNQDSNVSGIVVQLPLPKHLKSYQEPIVQSISDLKDVDGFTHINAHRLAARDYPEPYFIPCTPLGILRLLEEYQILIRGRRVVVVGHSNIVGMPMSHLLLRKWATVTTCHIHTENLQNVCREADILITATGHPGLITKDFVKSGATVIDVGITRVQQEINDGSNIKIINKIVGDCHENVAEVAGAMTPVPGGVGPMTVAMLLENTFKGCLLAKSPFPKGHKGS